MKRKTFKIWLVLALVPLLVTIVACAPAPTANTPQGQGVVEIAVTDPGPANVKSAVVYLTKVEVHRAADQSSANVSGEASENETEGASENETSENSTSDVGGQWITVINSPMSFDLMQIVGVTEVLGSANVTTGRYTQVRITVDKVDVVTTEGDNFTATVPSKQIKIVGTFTMTGDGKTALTLDFDGSKSLVVTGKARQPSSRYSSCWWRRSKAKEQENFNKEKGWHSLALLIYRVKTSL